MPTAGRPQDLLQMWKQHQGTRGCPLNPPFSSLPAPGQQPDIWIQAGFFPLPLREMNVLEEPEVLQQDSKHKGSPGSSASHPGNT